MGRAKEHFLGRPRKRFIDSSLIEDSNISIFSLQLSSLMIVSCSNSLAHKLGYSSAKDLVSHFQFAKHIKLNELRNFSLEELLEEKKLYGVEALLRDLNDKKHLLQLTLNYNPNTDIVVGVAIEIGEYATPMQGTEELLPLDLLKANSQFDQVLEFSKIGLFKVDASQFNLVDCDVSFAHMLGFNSVQSLLNCSLSENPLSLFPSYELLTRPLKEGGSPKSYTFPLKVPGSQNTRYFNVILLLSKEEGWINGSLADVTEFVETRKALVDSEIMLKEVTREIQGAVFQISVHQSGHLTFNYISDGILSLIGVSAKSIKKNPEKFFSFLKKEDLRFLLSFSSYSGENIGRKVFSFSFKSSSGDKKWAECVVTPYVKGDGRIVLNGFVVDVTDEKLREQRIESLEAQLSKSKKLETLGALAGGISHDLNNLLQSLQMNLDLVELNTKKGIEFDRMKMIKTVRKICDNGGRLVKQILSYCREDAPSLQSVELSHLVRSVLDQAQLTRPKNIQISYMQTKEAVSVFGEPTQLKQVVDNLCTNALYALRDHKCGLIEVKLSDESLSFDEACGLGLSGRRFARLSVRDNGPGIPEGLVKKVMEPFFTTKPIGEGTGMGLSIVNSIVQKHKGVVKINSTPGEGTMVVIWLPLSHAQAEELDKEEYLNSVTGTEKVIFLHMEPNYLEVSSKLLTDLGYEVRAFDNEPEFREWVVGHPESFDVVVVDDTICEVFGLELIEFLRNRFCSIPVILLSGFLSRDVSRSAQRLKIETLSKPYRFDELAHKIRSCF